MLNSTYSKDVFLLHIYYNTLFQLLNKFFEGDMLILSDEINKDYLRICSRISAILKKPEFENLRTYDWKPYPNLLVFDEYSFEEEWELEKYPLLCDFLTQVDTLFIEEGEQEYPLNDEEVLFLTKIRINLQKYSKFKSQQETNFFKRFAENYKHCSQKTESHVSSQECAKDIKRSDIRLAIRDISVLFGQRQGKRNIDFILEPFDVVEITTSSKELNKVEKIETSIYKFYNDKDKLASLLQSLIKFHRLDESEISILNESLSKLGLHLNDRKIEIIGITGTEPRILQETYENILKVIYDTGKDMERRVLSHKDRDEPALRDVLLSSLNSHKEILSSGETFNRKGKTDILVYSKGEIVFIAECKIWRGDTSFKQAIDQLISLYLTWNDDKASLIIFNRNKGFFDILDKIPDLVISFCEDNEISCEILAEYAPDIKNAFRYIFNIKNDGHKKILLTILVFDFYVD